MEFKRFLIQIVFEKGSETSIRLICSCFQKILCQTENFLRLCVLGLLLHSDASMQQLDIPVIVICNFFTKEYLSKISGVCHSPSRELSTSGYALGRQSSLGGVIPVVHHTGMSYLYNIPWMCRRKHLETDHLLS